MLLPTCAPRTALALCSARAPAVEAAAREEHVCLHVHGLPWALDERGVREAIDGMLPAGAGPVREMVLPLDRKARRTGRAVLSVATSGAANGTTADQIAAHLNGSVVGTRWLEVRPSSRAELETAEQQVAETQARAERLAPQQFLGDEETEARAQKGPLAPDDPRDLVILCHQTPAFVSAGNFGLNDLPAGRVDVLCRCVCAALFVSHGVRKSVHVWLVLRDAGLTVCVDGAEVRGLHPDERSIAAALRRALRTADRADGASGAGSAGRGWCVWREAWDTRLELLAGARADETTTTPKHRLLVLHESGAPLTSLATPPAPDAQPGASTCLVLGDHVGFEADEEALLCELGGEKASVGDVPLLTSQVIVMGHSVLDAVALQRQRRAATPAPRAAGGGVVVSQY